MRTFPSGKANTCMEPLIPLILKTLGGQNPNGFMDVTTLGGHGIHITRIQHIRRGKDLFRRTAFCPPRASKPIMRCPPSRIERHAETVHFLTKQQGLKAHLGGDCVHNISLSKKGKRRNILCDDRNASSLRRLGQIALLFPRKHIGMRLDEQPGGGKSHLRVVQHSFETFSIGTAKRNAGIPLCLIKDKNTRARSITKQSFSSTRRMIILAQIVTLDSFNGMLGGLQLPFQIPSGAVQQILQIGWLSGVVVDAGMVNYKGKRLRPLASESKGAQEAVFKRDIGKVMFQGITSCLIGCGFVAPAYNTLIFMLKKA